MPLVIYGLGGGHTDTHTHTLSHESDFLGDFQAHDVAASVCLVLKLDVCKCRKAKSHIATLDQWILQMELNQLMHGLLLIHVIAT